jgi:NAD(P)-dependent dehydrogenase (short-subunit alcohol dehydrogenase family)
MNARHRRISSTLAHSPLTAPDIAGLPLLVTSDAKLITTPFGFNATAAEVVDGIDLTGRRAVVTGASSGIGIETARALAGAGAAVTLAVRDVAAGEHVAGDIRASTGNPSVDARRVDLADLSSVRAFTASFDEPLHILVNNAGVMALPDRLLGAGGWELQLATNHLGHFLLAAGLHDALVAADGARIVSLSSVAHLRSPVVFDDLDYRRRPYDPGEAYGRSKTANVLFAVEATRRWSSEGIVANAVHPGAILESNLSRHMDPEVLAQLRSSGRYRYKTLAQGAATSVLLATSSLLAGIGGRYFEHNNEAVVVQDAAAGYAEGHGVAEYALDPGNARRLWDASEAALN